MSLAVAEWSVPHSVRLVATSTGPAHLPWIGRDRSRIVVIPGTDVNAALPGVGHLAVDERPGEVVDLVKQLPPGRALR